MNNYAAKVAHELRTPLAILRLKVEHAGHSIAPELAEELHAELHRLAYVVDQSLLIARAEHGRLNLQRTPCDLRGVVSDILEDFKLLARDQNRQLKFVSPSGVLVVADQRHLRQMIHNLLTNALKHGQGDFTVRIKASVTRPSVAVVNRVEWCPVNVEHTLGLGLRVVQVLLHLDPNVRFRHRRGNSYYAVRLSFPAATGRVALNSDRTRTAEPQPRSAAETPSVKD
jgi:signal transduction histidine kinase